MEKAQPSAWGQSTPWNVGPATTRRTYAAGAAFHCAEPLGLLVLPLREPVLHRLVTSSDTAGLPLPATRTPAPRAETESVSIPVVEPGGDGSGARVGSCAATSAGASLEPSVPRFLL